ncbi:uncharacterized protein VICG_01333 [Vittaforma corneae ATCC 50505]|uniref:L-type lectin-like domain-containing protein n=1 Tax=Vittaforma corneae (strain ATCC 50505) TaxID=993615 RepID=L2GM86_VITCO|nr:uncharacterized protein VICG_01333 [Vittaforma corneae ATCC 50505]ELA41585.1 hypothetical protein VICG_01333 [Vittaforma corneae ATCC 50505]
MLLAKGMLIIKGILLAGEALAREPLQQPQAKFIDMFSLIPPHVGANGREDFFDFFNEYVNKTRSRRDCTQLGYKAADSFAAIVSKNKFMPREYEITFDFSISNVSKGGKGAGFGFWISDQVINEPRFYGRNQNFSGFGAVIDIENSPYIKFVDSANTRKSGIPIKYSAEDSYKLVFTRRAGTLTIKFLHNAKEHILYTGAAKVPRESYLAVTSYSGASTCTLVLERIITNSFPSSGKKMPAKGERGGRSVYIVILGVAAILSLAYYLYQKKPKEFDLRK